MENLKTFREMAMVAEKQEVEIIINLGSDDNDYSDEIQDTYDAETDLSSGGIVLFFKTDKSNVKKIIKDLDKNYDNLDIMVESKSNK
jgi:hypothetical protein